MVALSLTQPGARGNLISAPAVAGNGVRRHVRLATPRGRARVLGDRFVLASHPFLFASLGSLRLWLCVSLRCRYQVLVPGADVQCCWPLPQWPLQCSSTSASPATLPQAADTCIRQLCLQSVAPCRCACSPALQHASITIHDGGRSTTSGMFDRILKFEF